MSCWFLQLTLFSPKLQKHHIEGRSVVSYNLCCPGVTLQHNGSAMAAITAILPSSVSLHVLDHRSSLINKIGRFPLAFQVIPGLSLALGIWFLQESPRWLMEKDRHEEAREALRRLHGNGSNDEYLDLEYREIHDTIVAEKQVSVRSWGGMVSKPAWRRRLALGMGIQAFGQLSGINVINYYGVTIYKLLGIDTRTSLMIIGISGSLSIVYCALGLYFLERFGRIKPMVFSALGMAGTLLVNAVLSQFYITGSLSKNPDPAALRAMVAMNLVFSLFFTFTGIITWVYPAEIFPVEIRARGNSLSTLMNWCLGLVIGQISPLALDDVGFKYFYAFFVFNLVAAVTYIFFFPE